MPNEEIKVKILLNELTFIDSDANISFGMYANNYPFKQTDTINLVCSDWEGDLVFKK